MIPTVAISTLVVGGCCGPSRPAELELTIRSRFCTIATSVYAKSWDR